MTEQENSGTGERFGEFVDGKMTFKLRRPIKAHNEEITEFVLREPNGKDMIEVGNPVEFDPFSDPPRLIPDAHKMAKMISRCGNLPPSSVEQISPKEQSQLGWILSPFFSPV